MAPFFCRLVMAPPLPPALTLPGLALPAAPGLALPAAQTAPGALPAAPAAPGHALPSAGSGELAILASGNGSRDSHQIWTGDTLRGACGDDHFEPYIADSNYSLTASSRQGVRVLPGWQINVNVNERECAFFGFCRPLPNAMASLLPSSVPRSDETQLLTEAREKVRACAASTSSRSRLIAKLGGPERACIMLSLASLDTDGNGRLTPEEQARYNELGARLVESTKNFHLNAGVVAALVLSVVFGLAYEEKDALSALADSGLSIWGSGEALGSERWTKSVANLLSFLAMQLAVSTAFLTVLLSSRLYAIDCD